MVLNFGRVTINVKDVIHSRISSLPTMRMQCIHTCLIQLCSMRVITLEWMVVARVQSE